MRIYKIKGHESAKCYVVSDSGQLALVSYTTVVCYTKNGKLYCTGLYSATTRKHIGWFLREFLPQFSYYDVKAIAGTEEGLDLV